MSFELSVVGDVNVDIVTPPIPALRREEQLEVEELFFKIGGSGAICAAAAARLGLKTCFFGLLGKDHFGDFLAKRMRKEGVVLKTKQLRSVRTGATLGFVFENGDKSFVSSFENNWKFGIRHVDKRAIAGSKHLHVSGVWHLRRLFAKVPGLLSFAHENLLTTSLDVGAAMRGASWKLLLSVLPHIDVLFVNKKELGFLGVPVKSIMKKVDVLAIHLGKRGTKIYTKKESFGMKARSARCVSPVGAGDVFNAGFLYAFLRHRTVKEAASFALKASTFYIKSEKQVFPSFRAIS